jgi:lipase chaperone LimK
MRGAQLDGHWGRLDAQGQLVPERALRQRFDHLLTLQGEASVEQLQAFVVGDVQAQHGPAQAQQVLALWGRYLELLRYRFGTPVVASDRQSWLAALAERQPVRQRILGIAWAQAFYAHEEQALREAAVASAPAAAAVISPTGLDASSLDAAARERLAAEKAAWADWESRLALAMQEWQRLSKAPELSDLQRHDTFERWLAAHFSASEARRVRLLAAASTGAGR